MLMVQLAIAVGVFRDAASPVNRSTALLWAGPEGSSTLTDSRGLDTGRASVLWVIPELERLEPFATSFGQLSAKPSSGDDFSMDFGSDGMRFVMLVYLNADENALLYARHVPADIRARLREAGTIVIGQEDAEALGVKVGDKLWLENRPLRLVGTLPGLQGLGMSTALIGTAGQTVPAPPAFWLLGLKPDTTQARIEEIADQLSSDLRLSILPSKSLSEATMYQFAFESGAGTIFMYSAGLAFVIAAMVVNQVMRAAVMGAMREYAALRAFGISFGRLAALVLMQGGLIAAGSVTMLLGLTLVLLAFLRWASVPYDLPPSMAAAVAMALVLVLCFSTLVALRNLRLADPSSLLR